MITVKNRKLEQFYYAHGVDFVSSGTEGIGRNRRYVFDLTLTRPGTESPDEDVLPGP